MYVDQPLRHFLDRLASSSPEPGGGSAAALVGALGAALISMVSNLTIGKEKYQGVQQENRDLLDESERLRSEMQLLIEKDTAAYGALAAVYKMPRDNEEEKALRAHSIQLALKTACAVPLEIARKALGVARLARRAAEIGNVAAVSDAGVAAVLAQACAKTAALNVRINVKSIKDEKYTTATWAEVQSLLSQVATIEREISETTYKKIG